MATLNDIETKIQSIIAILRSQIVKTITGFLPLTFNTNTAGAASDWSISGNDNVGKNKIEITAKTQTVSGVTFTVDKQAGTITVNGKANAFAQFIIPFSTVSGNYYFSGCAIGGSSNTYYLIAWDNSVSGRAKQWDGLTNSENDYGATSNQIMVDSTHNHRLIICINANYTADNLIFKPMLRPADTSADFEPYQVGVGQRTENLANSADDLNGCNINSVGAIITNNEYKLAMFQVVQGETYTLSTSDTQTVYAFYENKPVLGSQSYDSQRITTGLTFTAPITGWCAFRNVSSSSTQMAVKGSTAPISYVPYGYEIPISVNGTPQTFYIGNTPLTAGQSISKTSTGVDIELVEGENTVSTTLYNKPEMTIKYKLYGGN